MKQKATRLLFIISGTVLLLFLIIYTIAIPSVISGDPIPPFTNRQLVFSEKITYLFSKPQINEVVMFVPQEGNNRHIGAVVGVEGSYYQIITGQDEQKSWLATEEQIESRVFWPTSKKVYSQK